MATDAMESRELPTAMATDTVVMRELVDFILAKRWIWDGQVIKFFSEEWWTRIPLEVISIIIL